MEHNCRMPANAMRSLLTLVGVSTLVALQIQSAKAGGTLQIALISYVFSYQTEDGSTTPPRDKTITVSEEYANSYKSQWNVSGVLPSDRRSEKAHSQNIADISVEEWPWNGTADCSGNTHYRFLMCLDYVNSYDPQRPCVLQRLQTGLIPVDRAAQHREATDGESITFNNYLMLPEDNQSTISNPLTIRFPDWKGPVRLAVYIDCCTDNSRYKGQCKEMVSTTIDLTPRTFLEGRLTIRRVLNGRGSYSHLHRRLHGEGFTKHSDGRFRSRPPCVGFSYNGMDAGRLERNDILRNVKFPRNYEQPNNDAVYCNIILLLSFGVSCEPDYYRRSCDVHCHVDNVFTEHKFCNTSSGRKRCLPGWSGPGCQTDVNECHDPICQHGGTCVNRPGAFLCLCLMGTSGRFCERRIPLCHLRPCQNGGTCLDTPTNTTCFCALGFTGPLCQFQLQEINELTTVMETTQTPTTIAGLSSSLPSTIHTVEVTRSKALEHKEAVHWQHWYLAVILGGVLLVAFVITVVVLLRFNITNGYKVTLSFSSSRRANILRSSQRETHNVINELYQLENDNRDQPSVFNVLHNNHAFDTDENIIFDKAAFDSKTKTHTGNATAVNDYLYLCSGTVSSSSVDKVRFSSMTTHEINTNKRKQHKQNKRTDHTDHHYTELMDSPVFTKPSQGQQGPYAVSSCFNDHLGLSKGGRSKSALLAAETEDAEMVVRNRQLCFPKARSTIAMRSTWDVIKDTNTTTNCNLHANLNTRSDGNEYDEIDTSHMSQPYQSKLTQRNFPNVGRKLLGHNSHWLRTATQEVEGREDDGGYLVPRVHTTPSLKVHRLEAARLSCSGIYDYPRLKDVSTLDTHNSNSIFKFAQESHGREKSSTDSASISHISVSSNISVSDRQDEDKHPLDCTPNDYNTIENSTEHLYANSIYVNTSLYYNDINILPPE